MHAVLSSSAGGIPSFARQIRPTEPTSEPAPFLKRTSGGSTFVPAIPPSYVPRDDVIPPGRITDLRVDSTSYDDGMVTLTLIVRSIGPLFSLGHYDRLPLYTKTVHIYKSRKFRNSYPREKSPADTIILA